MFSVGAPWCVAVIMNGSVAECICFRRRLYLFVSQGP